MIRPAAPDEASAALFAAARRVMPGGVSSPVRAFGGVGGTPRFLRHGNGAYVTDADGNRYVDYVLSWGAIAVGHAHPAVVDAIARQAALGTSFGAPTTLETALAERIVAALPSVELVRFVSSGTEATMSALRLARAATGRSRIIKFAGCYHGHADALLVQAGSGVATLTLPDSPGVPIGAVADTLVLPYNDLAATSELFARMGDTIAAVIVEPIAGNMGMVAPGERFLPTLRDLTRRHGSLLIFDEVMTGFRVAWGGAQLLYSIDPDLTCLGKVIGGGLPAAAYGGRRELMEQLAPMGQVYQAGTLSGNPLAMAAGIATLDELARPGTYDRLGALSAAVVEIIRSSAAHAGVPVQTAAVGGMWGFFLNAAPVTDYDSAKRSDTAGFARLFHALLERGVYIAPSAFEAGFVSTAHDEAAFEETRAAFTHAMAAVRAPSRT